MRTLRAITTMAITCGALTAGAAAAAEGPPDGNVVLVLEGGLRQGGVNPVDVEFEFPVRNGAWPQDAWGYGPWFSRGHHKAAVTGLEPDGDGLKVSLDVRVFGDPWAAGGRARYDILLKREGERFAGTYRGTFVQDGPKGTNFAPPGPEGPAPPPAPAPTGAPAADLTGRVTGRIGPVWPVLVKGFIPPGPGEHPRLALRKSDLAPLRKRAAETPEGRAMLARAKAVLGRRGPADAGADKITTWPAVGQAFLYAMTGEPSCADQAREIVDRTLFNNPNGRRGDGITQDIHHGPRLQGLALAFDLAFDGWDAAYRQKCIDEIALRARELFSSTFEGAPMSGANPNPWSNHNAIRVGCAVLGALAVQGEKDSRGEVLDFRQALELGARELRGHYRTGLGQSGYCMEGGYYKVMTMQRGSVHAIRAIEKGLGWRIVEGLGDFDILGYFLEADPGRTPGLDPVCWAAGMGTVPPDMMPAAKWFHTRAVGLEGDKSFGIGYGMLAPFAFATYPFDVAEKPPWDGGLRWAAPDLNKGHFIIRPAWKDRQDILLVMNLKTATLRGSWAPAVDRSGPNMHHTLWGFGLKWMDGAYLVKVADTASGNPHHGAAITGYREPEPRTLVLDMDLDRAYMSEAPKGASAADLGAQRIVNFPSWAAPMADFGIRATRRMAVDCSGKSGSPLLVALVDRVTAPKREGAAASSDGHKPTPQEAAMIEMLRKKYGRRAPAASVSDQPTVWGLPMTSAAGRPTVEGNLFIFGDRKGPTLAGVLVTPPGLSESATAAGPGTYFVVFTLQAGPAPAIAVEGEGLAARVKVGGRTVRFAGDTILLE